MKEGAGNQLLNKRTTGKDLTYRVALLHPAIYFKLSNSFIFTLIRNTKEYLFQEEEEEEGRGGERGGNRKREEEKEEEKNKKKKKKKKKKKIKFSR